jgi:hypothetical protein
MIDFPRFSCIKLFPGCQHVKIEKNDERFVATIKIKFLSIGIYKDSTNGESMKLPKIVSFSSP